MAFSPHPLHAKIDNGTYETRKERIYNISGPYGIDRIPPNPQPSMKEVY